MGLIEKAGGALGATHKPLDELAAEEPATALRSHFNIDFIGLAQQGFYAPADRSSQLALDLRAIKRGLLRRIGLRNAAGDPRIARKGGRQRNLVLVTSTRPGEGKTFSAINLALSLVCEEEIEVLLVDADAPRPKIRAHFGLPESKGLTDRLMERGLSPTTYEYAARQAPLTILSEGSQVSRPCDLFAEPSSQRFFAELSMNRPGRLVIIDAPPVLATTEAIALARHVDEVIFVVEADATTEAGVGAALDEVLEANTNVSLVLNRCLIGPAGSYYGSYGDYDRARGDAADDARTER